MFVKAIPETGELIPIVEV